MQKRHHSTMIKITNVLSPVEVHMDISNFMKAVQELNGFCHGGHDPNPASFSCGTIKHDQKKTSKQIANACNNSSSAASMATLAILVDTTTRVVPSLTTISHGNVGALGKDKLQEDMPKELLFKKMDSLPSEGANFYKIAEPTSHLGGDIFNLGASPNALTM